MMKIIFNGFDYFEKIFFLFKFIKNVMKILI